MGKNKHKSCNTSYPKPKQLSFPADEAKNSWLPILLNVYHQTDKGVYEAVQKREKKGEKLACAKGCSSCCTTHTTIPVYPMELLGIYWYTIEVITGEVRETIIKQLKQFDSDCKCPFLIEPQGACGIHPIRPMACRYFNVFNTPCEVDEDPYYSRRKDVLTPIAKHKNKALELMLPFHGIIEPAKKREAIKTGYLHDFAQNLQELEWDKLAKRMENHV